MYLCNNYWLKTPIAKAKDTKSFKNVVIWWKSISIHVGDDIQRYHKKVLVHDNNLFVSFYHHLSDTTYKHVYLNQKDAIACDILGYK